MNFHQGLVFAYRLIHRYNPFRAEVGLFPIGNPGPDSPVLVSGNYASTVDMLFSTLSGCDCWLLVCDSAGINVWCAAGVGDFNENKVIDTIVATNLETRVRNRKLVFPPLAASGIDRKKLATDTGFSIIWGPSHLNDLPEFLRSGCKRSPEMRIAKFPFRDRLEQSIGILGVFLFPVLLIFRWPRQVKWFMFSIVHAIFGSMLGYHVLPSRAPANKTMFLGLVQSMLVLFLSPGWSAREESRDSCKWTQLPVSQKLFFGVLAHFLIAIDMIGSTPFFKSTIFHWLTTGDNESLFQPGLNSCCTSCGICLEVCPKGLFSRNTSGKIEIDLSQGCCECLACVKQCPQNAFENVGTDFKDDIKSIDEDILKRFRK